MDTYAEFTIEEVQELWQRKARLPQAARINVTTWTRGNVRMVDRNLRAELEAARVAA